MDPAPDQPVSALGRMTPCGQERTFNSADGHRTGNSDFMDLGVLTLLNTPQNITVKIEAKVKRCSAPPEVAHAAQHCAIAAT